MRQARGRTRRCRVTASCAHGFCCPRWASGCCSCLLLMAAVWDDVQVPDIMPWTDKIAAQILSNVQFLPLSFFYIHMDLSALCHPEERGSTEVVTRVQVAHRFVREMWFVLLAVTLYNAILWLPVFVLDWILRDSTSLSDSSITSVNIAFTILIIGSIVRFIRAKLAHRETKVEEMRIEQRRSEIRRRGDPSPVVVRDEDEEAAAL